MGFAEFFSGKKSHFPADRTDLKIVARWRYDWCANAPYARENLQNLNKDGYRQRNVRQILQSA